MVRLGPVAIAGLLAACGAEEPGAVPCTRGPEYGHELQPSPLDGSSGAFEPWVAPSVYDGPLGLRLRQNVQFVPGTRPRADELLPFDAAALATALLAATSLVTWPERAEVPARAALAPAPDPLGGVAGVEIAITPARPLEPGRAYAVRVAKLPADVHASAQVWLQLADCSLVARFLAAP